MAQIKTVTTTSGENTVTFDAFYPYIWIRNTGDNDITAANYSGAQAGDENTVSVKSGEVAMIQAETENIYIIGATTCEIHAQGFAECPFKRVAKGGEQISVESLSVTQNGTYTAPSGKAYSPVVVDVQEQPWQPLEDGYSNFWFELTDDTLSPWLNFSAKNADAVIDWGDGSGEQALDTLTPTHTYSKAGKYVVKVKGVTGIAAQITTWANVGNYISRLHAIELSDDVISMNANVFYRYAGIKYIKLSDNITRLLLNSFYLCGILTSIEIPQGVTAIGNTVFVYCTSLTRISIPEGVETFGDSTFSSIPAIQQITIPSTVISIGNSCFAFDAALREIHCQPTTPPTLGTNAFNGLPSDYIIYVPVGYGETYKSAEGWSAYSDHILEEGQTVTRAMQKKFAKEAKAIEDTEDMR